MVRTITCIALILLCLGVSLFPKKFWDLGFRLGGNFWQEQVKQWPVWMFPFWLWIVRIAGILGAMVAIWLLVDGG